MQQLLGRAADQVLIAENGWRYTLRDVLNDLIEEVMLKEREKEFWKREFYKQEARATKAEIAMLNAQKEGYDASRYPEHVI